MRIIIVGVGEVGFHVAKALSEEDHDITVIDIDPLKCKRASESLDVIVQEGNGASPKNLLNASVESADYVLCLTTIDEVNLIASQQARELGAKKIIARLRNQDSLRSRVAVPHNGGLVIFLLATTISQIFRPAKLLSRFPRHCPLAFSKSFRRRFLQVSAVRFDMVVSNCHQPL